MAVRSANRKLTQASSLKKTIGLKEEGNRKNNRQE